MATKKEQTKETKEQKEARRTKEAQERKELVKELGVPESITLTVGNIPVVAMLRRFSSGSVGYYANGKAVVEGKPVQVGASVILIGTKPE